MIGVTPIEATRFSFEAMGVTVELLADASGSEVDAAFADVADEFERLEQVFSRFRPDSELSRLNLQGSATASPELLEVVEAAVAARASSGGRFDPAVHDALVACGYDRTFSQIEDEDDRRPPGQTAPCGGSISIDQARGVITLGRGARIDLGGIAKGYAVDRACDLLGSVSPCLVNAGGDLAVRGLLTGDPWPVGVETAGEPLTLGLASGALATSGCDYRRWRRGGEEMHHLIDPTTGRPAVTDLLRVTAAGRTAVEAEIRAKCLLLAGEQDGPRGGESIGHPQRPDHP